MDKRLIEEEVRDIMSSRPEAVASWMQHGHGMTLYDYVKMVVTEYHRIKIDVYA